MMRKKKIKNKKIITSICAATFSLIPILFFVSFFSKNEKLANKQMNIMNSKVTIKAREADELSSNTDANDYITNATNINNYVSAELQKFKALGINLIKSTKIKGNAKFNIIALQQPIGIGTITSIGNTLKETSVTVPIDNTIGFDFQVPNDNDIIISTIRSEVVNHLINFRTGEGYDKKFTVPWDQFALNGENLNLTNPIKSMNMTLTLNQGNPLTCQKYKVIDLNSLQADVKKIVNLVGSSESADSGAFDALTLAWYVINYGYGMEEKPTFYFDDKENGFFNQYIYHFKKNEVNKWFQFAFDPIDEQGKELLKNGPTDDQGKNRPWNLADISNNRMPTLIKWNEAVTYLFEFEKVFDFIVRCEVWKDEVGGENPGWASAIDNLINPSGPINTFQFENYQQLEKLYSKYHDVSLNGGTPQDFISEVKGLGTNLSNNSVAHWKNKLNERLKNNGFWPFTVNNNIPNIPNSTNNNIQFRTYKILSYLLKGVLCSNQITISGLANAYDPNDNKFVGSTEKTDNIILYSSNANTLTNDYLKQLFVDTPFEQGTTNQKISISNFNFKNDNNTKFVNIEGAINYQGFEQNNLTIKFNAHAIDYNGIEFDTWTKNKDAIGISLNKYLSEIVVMENTDNKQRFSFLNDNFRKDVLNYINGKYQYDDNGVIKTASAPVWLTSARANEAGGAYDQKYSLLDDLYPINTTQVNDLISKGKFSLEEWNQAWEKFNIKTDEASHLEPLIKLKQNDGTFFVIGKINKFNNPNSNYKNLYDLASIAKPPIVWINNKASGKYDGYFLIKLKLCFDKKYNLNINNKRFYEIYNSGIEAKPIKWAVETYIKKIITGSYEATDDKNTLVEKNYWNKKVTSFKNESFFQNNGYDINTYSLDNNKIWFNLLSPNAQAGIILNANEKKIAVEYFKTQTELKLFDVLKTKYGIDSDEVKTFDNYLQNFNNVQMLMDACNVENEAKPFVFDKQYWDDLEKYNQYLQINSAIIGSKDDYIKDHPNIPPEAWENVKFFDDEVAKQAALDKDVFYTKYIKDNENVNINLQNFATINSIKNFLSIVDIEDDSIYPEDQQIDPDDVFLINLRKGFFNFYQNWNKNSLSPSGGEGYEQWKEYIQKWLDDNNIGNKYQYELEETFLNDFGDWITKGTSRYVLKSGTKINNNLLFSSIEELANDPLIGLILANYGLNVDDVFVKSEYKVNDTAVPNEYCYTVKDDVTLPFSITTKYINGIKYYAAVNDGTNLKLNISLDFLQKLANISFEENKKKVYKLINPNTGGNEVVHDQINNLIADLENVFKIGNNQNMSLVEILTNGYHEKVNDWTQINVGAICLVTILPIVLCAVILLVWWLLRTRKRKTQF